MSYPCKTITDQSFYKTYLAGRMPPRIFDAHIHLNLPEHIPFISQERLHGDWAFECGLYLSAEDALAQGAMLFPGVPYTLAGFPWPIREADLAANNAYLLEKKAEGLVRPFMATRPDWDPDELDRQLSDFCGFKPYPDFVVSAKGAEASIFDFMPHAQLEVLNRHKKAVVLHLPRKDRLADKNNLRELLTMREHYPDIQIIIAHLGRSFCPIYLERGLDGLGSAVDGFYFDTAAVFNPVVYEIAFRRIRTERILFGTDGPILYWHGKRRWTETTYENLCREDYSWNRHAEGAEAEAGYTFILYEQLRAMFDAMERAGFGPRETEAIFAANAEKLLTC